jgi:hypothetical protein
MNTKTRPASLTTLVVGVVAVWLMFSGAVYWAQPDWEQRGQFGDMFGAVNALFSALAFAILIHTMWLQREELALQREELEQTREELRRSANAQEASQKALEDQIELLTVSTRMSAWLKAQEVWTERRFTEGRGKMFMRLRLGPAVWSAQDTEDGKEVCRRLDEFAHLAPFLGQDKVLDVWDDPLAKAWLVLEPVVLAERENSRWQTKWQSFENLGQAALAKLVREGRDPRVSNQH